VLNGILRAMCCAGVMLCAPHTARAQAQRTLHWDRIDVDATLNDAGTL